MIWKRTECFLIKKDFIVSWIRQLAKLCIKLTSVTISTIDPLIIKKILQNTEEIKKQQSIVVDIAKFYSQAAVTQLHVHSIHIKLQSINIKHKKVKITICKQEERNKSITMNTKVILDAVWEVELKQATKKILTTRRLLSKDIIFSVFNKNARLMLERSPD